MLECLNNYVSYNNEYQFR